MIYVLYDKPKKLEDMSFLTAAFEKEYKEIYPEWRCTSIKQMLSVCSTTVKRTKSGDTIVCWYDFMGVLCWWLSKLTNKKIKVIAINILLKDKNTTKNKVAKYLYKKALCSNSFAARIKKSWLASDEVNVEGQRFVLMKSEQTENPPLSIILHESGAFVTQTADRFNGEVTAKIQTFLREQKPELLHHQKFLENGTAERAKESGTEQNYNMIDGCVNNNPKKPRIIGNRISVLDRLHIKLEERKQKGQPQQQRQQERSRKN